MFTREELQSLEKRALELSAIQFTSESWVRVYLRLADACSELDAYLARSTVEKEGISCHSER